ncbi:hypothetical protein ACFQ1L_30035 [Phytohabitans flavus]|uniref:hypothetical protein n=1 Tax=Phytohabitans flavus TaxID=1076124 RepID=UPI00363F93D7
MLSVATVAAVALSGIATAQPSNSTDVITPEAARVIFVQTVAEARGGTLVHIDAPIRNFVRDSVKTIFPDAGSQLTGIGVGVPRGQHGYPAYFVAAGQVSKPDGATYLAARFDRANADQPWLMSSLSAWGDRVAAAPRLDPDGYLAPTPVADLVVEPARLPELYLDWWRRSDAAGAVVADPLLAPAGNDSWLRALAVAFAVPDEFIGQFSKRYAANPGPVSVDLIPLADGRALATFDVTVHRTLYNRPGYANGPCGTFVTLSEVPGMLRQADVDWHVHVQALIPTREAAAVPTPSPAPGATTQVIVDDSFYVREVTDTVPC